MNDRRLSIGCLFVLICLSVACRQGAQKPAADGAPTSRQPQKVQRKELIIAIANEPAHLVAWLRPDAWARRIAGHTIVESLVRFSPTAPHKPVGELAQSWRYDQEKRRYTFTLRKQVKWHDGKPFTTDDVVFSFDRLFDPNVQAESTRSQLKPFIKSYRATGPHTFEIDCAKSSPFFLLALETLAILPKHRMASGNLNKHPLLRAPIGTGPFKFAGWDSGREIRLQRWQGYWGKPAGVGKITFRVVRTPDVAVRMAIKGQVDFVPRVPAGLWRSQVANNKRLGQKFQHTKHLTPGIGYVLINHRRPALKKLEVRTALSQLLDLKTITEKIVGGGVEPVGSLYFRKDPEYDPTIKPVSFSPEAAGKQLDAAGITDTNGDGYRQWRGKRFKLRFLTVASSKSTRRWLTGYQQNLKKAGIELEIVALEWAAFLDRIRKQSFDLAALGMALSGPYTDLFGQFHSSQFKQGQNYGGYANAQADALMTQIRTTLDDKVRAAASLKLQRLLRDDLPVIPLFTMVELGLVSRALTQAPRSAIWYDLAKWSFRKDG